MIKRLRLFMSARRVRLLEVGLLLTVAVFFAGSLNSGAQAPSYPTRGITLIYPFAAGATADIFTRSLAPQLARKFGAPVDVLCKPGGAAMIGTLEVMKARKDGYMLLVDCPGSSSLQKALGSELPYKIEERTYMVRAAVNPQAFIVPVDRPWKTLKDVEEAIRRDPANFRWGSAGKSNFSDFSLNLFKAALSARGVDLSQTKTVPFASGEPAKTAVAGGHVDIWVAGAGPIAPLLDAGKVRSIATTAKERSRFFPGVPTCVEQGYAVTSLFWTGYSGPSGLPKNVVEKWIDAIREIVNNPANLPIFDKIGGDPAFLAGEEFRKYVLEEAKAVEKMTSP